MNLIKEFKCALKKGMHYKIITAAIASSIITAAISAFATAAVGLGPGLDWMTAVSGLARIPASVDLSVVATAIGLIGFAGLILDHQRPYRCYYPSCAASRSSSHRLHEV